MPKESKKFINPLLRPSQEVEVKTEPAPKQQKNASEEHEPSYSGREEVQPQATMLAKPAQASGRGAEVISPYAVEEEDLAEEQAPRPAEGQGRKAPYSPANKRLLIDEPAPYIATSGPTGQEPDLVVDQAPQTSPVTSERSTRLIVSPPSESEHKANTYTFSETHTSTSSSFDDQQDMPGKKREQFSFKAADGVRRKKGEQAFERMHERITIWLDKRLKLAFDELATERDLPKTALLNEAIADLLRKYDAN